MNLLPLADITVVPSVFPEAFGMVAAEAAAAGSIPLVANHSGLAEVADGPLQRRLVDRPVRRSDGVDLHLAQGLPHARRRVLSPGQGVLPEHAL